MPGSGERRERRAARLGGRLRPWRTLSGRIALAAIGGLVVASVIFFAVAVSLIRSQAERTERDRLDQQAVAMAAVYARQVRAAALHDDPSRCRIDARNLQELGGRGTQVGIDLQPRAACRSDLGRLPPEIVRRVNLDAAAARGVQRLTVSIGPRGTTYLASAAPLVVNRLPVGTLVLARPKAEIAVSWGQVAPRVLLAAASGLAVALLLVTVLSRRVTSPLRRLARATQRVADGDRSVTMGPAGTVEIDRLATSFNRMVAELAERDRLAHDFLMRVTHDLRTPLTAIRGHAAALADGIVPPAAVNRSLVAIESEAGRLERLVADILDLASMDADRVRLDIGEVDPAPVVGQVCELNRTVAREREVALEPDLATGLRVRTDPVRVGQIVANLVDNALRWTPPGGRVAVRLAAGAAGGVEVEVADTGPGVPPEERERIFEPFRSSAPPDGERGTGLGLAHSRELARVLGGDVTVGAAAGGGSAFLLRLPAEAPATRPA